MSSAAFSSSYDAVAEVEDDKTETSELIVQFYCVLFNEHTVTMWKEHFGRESTKFEFRTDHII